MLLYSLQMARVHGDHCGVCVGRPWVRYEADIQKLHPSMVTCQGQAEMQLGAGMQNLAVQVIVQPWDGPEAVRLLCDGHSEDMKYQQIETLNGPTGCTQNHARGGCTWELCAQHHETVAHKPLTSCPHLRPANPV